MSAMSCTEIMSLSDMKNFFPLSLKGAKYLGISPGVVAGEPSDAYFLTKSYRIIAGGISATGVVGIP